MPIHQSVHKTFDPHDEDSWFFGFMSRADATELLSKNSDIGAFLVRESTTEKGDLVLSVKESNDKVSHYIIKKVSPEKPNQNVKFIIGEQTFLDIPTLLDYYMKFNLDESPLKIPATPKEQHLFKRSFTKDYLSEISSDTAMMRGNNGQFDTKAVSSNFQRKLPDWAKVIQARIPNAYDKTALTLHEGEVIKVTKMDISGCWEGEATNGRRGHFPFNYVRFIEDPSSHD